MKFLLLAAVVVLAVVEATVYFEERFEDGGEWTAARAAVIGGEVAWTVIVAARSLVPL